MPNHSVYDSMGSWNTTSNPYDVCQQSHPKLIRVRAAEYTKARDVLENSKGQFEKRLIQRITKGDLPDPILFFLMIGKYALLALTLPPFLFFYRFPKWTINTCLPPVKEQVQAVLKWLSHRGSLVLNRVQTLSNKIINPIQQFFQKIQNLSSGIGKKLKFFTSEIQNRLTHLIKKIHLPQDFFRSLRELKNSLLNRMSEFNTKGQENLKQLQQRFSLLSQWFDKKLRQAESYFNRISSFVSDQWKKVVGKFDLALNRLKKLTNRINESTEPAKKWLSKQLESFERFGQAIKKKGEELAEAIKERVEGPMKQITTTLQQMIQAIPLPAFSLFAPVVSVFNQFREGTGRFGKRFPFKKRLNRMKEKWKKGKQMMMGWLTLGKKTARQLLEWIIPKIKLVPSLLLKILNRCKRTLLQLLRFLNKLIILFVTFIRITCRLIFNLVREVYSEVI